MHKITVVMGAMFAALAAASAHAQNYPAKTVRIVVPFPAGGSTDIIGRVVAEQLTAAFGQQAIVDNRPGANGVIGTELVAKAAPDGYTLLIGGIGSLSINHSTSSRANFSRLPTSVNSATNTGNGARSSTGRRPDPRRRTPLW